MHPVLRRYAEPPRTFVPFFGLGVIVGIFVISVVSDRIAVFDREEAQAELLREEAGRQAEARDAVRRYSYEAFAHWSVDHPTETCPTDRSELDRYLDISGADPWGGTYHVACDHRGRLIAWSYGPDGTFRTNDDVSTR